MVSGCSLVTTRRSPRSVLGETGIFEEDFRATRLKRPPGTCPPTTAHYADSPPILNISDRGRAGCTGGGGVRPDSGGATASDRRLAARRGAFVDRPVHVRP